MEKFSIEKLRNILETYDAKECENLIVGNSCESCTCYNSAACPFYCPEYPWALNIRYDIVDKKGD